MSQTTEDTWYYSAGTERKGPYPASQVRALVDAGTLDDQTLFWTAGMANWVPLRETPFASRTSPPPFSGLPPALQPASATMDDGPRPLGFTDAISLCFRKYVTFSGRAGRSEFWYFMLFIFVAGVVATILDLTSFGGQNDIMPINTIFTLAVILPELSVSVRRLHDTDRSGWWVLISLIPLIGIITLIVFCCQKGTQGRNRFG
jgi:uncharacterized membrane protein YhaH (DUF805 family)